MKLLKKISVITLVVTLATSCSMQNGFIQKRKYSKGYHVSLKKNHQAFKGEIQPTETIESSSITSNSIEKTISPSKNTQIEVKSEITTPVIRNINVENSEIVSTNENEINEEVIPTKNSSVNKVDRPLFSKNRNQKINFNPFKTNSNVSEVKETAVVNTILLYILCFFIPFLAVGLATDWEIGKVLLNLLLMLLFVIPAIIHALIVVSRNS